MMKGNSELQTDFSQLWSSEQKILTERAAVVPDNGIIVDIGTAQGGSASIFDTAVGHRGVRIYSFDISPSVEAYERLKGTNVAIVAKSSIEGAREWRKTVGKSVDLIFIDGSHALQNVFEDFNFWVPHLKPGGEVIFHDFDSIERGGLVHLGVYIVLRTILKQAIFEKPVHRDRLLYGTIVHPNAVRLEGGNCWKTFVDLGRQITRACNTDYAGWFVVGEGQFARLLVDCLDVDRNVMLLSTDQVNASGNYLVLSRPLETALDTLRQRGISKDSVVAIDNLQACYIVDRALHKKRDHLLPVAWSRKELFRWEEILFMFEHGCGSSLFPYRLQEIDMSSNVGQLSRMVAYEQVRLTFLSHILEALVGWKP
jgi:hypothetical protein